MHYLSIITILISCLSSLPTVAQQLVPSVKTEKDTIAVYTEGEKGNFPHYNQANSMYYTLAVKTPDTISIVSEIDSIAFIVHPKDSMIFDVVREQGQDTLHCFFYVVEKQEHANFSEEYQRTHRGKTFVEIPEVYELVNIVYALTPAGKTDSDIVRQSIPYYDEVIAHFGQYDQSLTVMLFDSLLRGGEYHELKMDAYAFSFEGGRIKQSSVYNIVSWKDYNTLAPYADALDAFARRSDFKEFYKQHQALYQDQIVTYQDSIDTNGMRIWLEQQFPSTQYDAFKIIFSPLVNGNQSSCNFENNGFKELQAHVNYPYKWSALQQYPPDVVSLIRGNIVFTELNHGYINPEADKPTNSEGILEALDDLSKWTDNQKPAGNYNNSYQCFNEYMNWGLVSLYYVDHASEEYLSKLTADIESMMVNRRGFIKFSEFNQFLVKLYQSREEDRVIADLYPQIIDWFAAN